MNWNAIGAIGETLGALGVIVSLVYLATQLKSNSVASAVEAKLNTTRFMTEFNRDFILHPGLYDLWDRGSKDPEVLNAEETARFSNLNLNAFWYFAASFYQYRVDRLTPGDLFELEQIMEFWLTRKGIESWWLRFGHTRFNSDFVN